MPAFRFPLLTRGPRAGRVFSKACRDDELALHSWGCVYDTTRQRPGISMRELLMPVHISDQSTVIGGASCGYTTLWTGRAHSRPGGFAVVLVLLLAVFGAQGQTVSPPSNDHFTNSHRLLGTNVALSGLSARATFEAGEPKVFTNNAGTT